MDIFEIIAHMMFFKLMVTRRIPQVLVADNDDTGSEVAADTDHQEDAGSDKVQISKKVISRIFIMAPGLPKGQ